MARFIAFAAVCGVLLASGTHAVAESTGKVRAMRGTATALGLKGERALSLGSAIGVGDVVSTGSDGVLQIAFGEKTHFVVGEAASVKVETVKLEAAGDGKALKLEALEGAFRFISDERSDKDFKIRTPSATIALTGTAVDLTVTPSGGTRLLLLDGGVTMCGIREGAACRTVATPCAMLRTDDGRSVEQVEAGAAAAPGQEGTPAAESPAIPEEIRENFPYQRSQSELLEEFRIAGQKCLQTQTGGLAQAPLGGSQIRISPVVPILVIGGAGVACLVFCKSRPDPAPKTN